MSNIPMSFIKDSAENTYEVTDAEARDKLDKLPSPIALDPTFTNDDAAAPAGETGRRFDKLTEEIDEISKNFVEEEIPTKNLWNPETVTVGAYIGPTGKIDSNELYTLTDYISVNPGDVVVASWVNDKNKQEDMAMRYTCLFDKNKQVVSGGSDLKSSIYTVPDGVYYMRISIYSKTNYQYQQIEIASDGNFTPYAPYDVKIEKSLTDNITVPEVKAARGGHDTLADRLNAMTAKADFSLNLPPKLYALVGEELNVYFDNIITDGRDTDYDWDVTCTVGQQMARGYALTPSEAGEHAITIKATKDGVSVEAESTIIVSAANQGSGVTRSMIILGDSTTNNSNATLKIADNFGNDPMGLTLLGTRGTAPNNHEGRSGWTLAKYHTTATESVDSSVVNPFFNPATSKFDAAYYFINSGVPVPDYFVINMGINDVFGYGDDEAAGAAIETCVGLLNDTIASVRSAAPDAKICVALTIPPNYSQDAFGKAYKCSQTRNRYKRNNALWVAKLIEEYQGRESEGIYLLPINTNLDTRYNMGFESAQVNRRNSETYQQPIANGGVHPVESGYWQIADVYWFFLKSFEA